MAVNKDNIDQMWREWFETDAFKVEKRLHNLFSILPHDPRCKLCHTPFDGIGGMLVRALYGRKPSSLNPRFCNVCEDFASKFPGGADVKMSMLFADVRGSTALSEKLAPSEYKKMIDRFYVGAAHAVAAEDGLVDNLAGDAVAAFWGAGFAGADYTVRTVRAAQAIARLMRKQDIPVGIGVHAGVAYFGAIGAAGSLVDISAIGEEVNTAARIASQAAAGEILLSETALSRAGIDPAGLETRRLELKGIREPVAVRVMHG